MLAAGEIDDPQPAVGAALGVCHALGGVADPRAVGRPADLLAAAERLQRRVDAFAGQQVLRLAADGERQHEQMAVGAVLPLIPVPHQQMVVDARVGLRQVRVAIVDVRVLLDVLRAGEGLPHRCP